MLVLIRFREQDRRSIRNAVAKYTVSASKLHFFAAFSVIFLAFFGSFINRFRIKSVVGCICGDFFYIIIF